MLKKLMIGIGALLLLSVGSIFYVNMQEPVSKSSALDIAMGHDSVQEWLHKQNGPFLKIASTENDPQVKSNVIEKEKVWEVTLHSESGENPMVLRMSVDKNSGEVTSVSEQDRVIILFKEEVDVETIEESDGTVLEVAKELPIASATVPSENVDHLEKDPSILVVEDDQLVTVHQQSKDWGIGKVRATSAWNNNLTGKGIKIAVVDTGIDLTHNDLVVAGGASFVDYTTSYQDDNGHGTHVAGIIGARNNTIGTVGVAYNSSIYAVKVLDGEGDGYLSSIIKGIDWAISNKMDVINLSLGSEEPSEALELAVNKANQNHILVVASAGNAGELPLQNTIGYPAKYPTSIAVGAVDEQLKKATFSSFGKELEVVAPGVGILSTYLDNTYASISGTSMAAPYVTGTLALLKEANPTSTASELRTILQKNIQDLGTLGRDSSYGFGFIQTSTSESTHGQNRYETSVMISKKGWKDGASSIILARGDRPTDALTGSVLATKLGAPILLTKPTEITSITLDEIKRISPSNVVIVGGEMAISTTIENKLRSLGYTVQRIAGETRYATATSIANEVGDSQEAFLATGDNSPDALSIASFASLKSIPILLTGKKGLPQEVIDFIKGKVIKKVTIIGGESAIPLQIEGELTRLGVETIERISGQNRYDTSASIVRKYRDSFQGPVYVASGKSFVDALPGASLAAKSSSPIILVQNEYVPTEISDMLLSTYSTSPKLSFLGGYSVIAIGTRIKMERLFY